MEKDGFELYAAGDTVVAVRGGVKRRILHLLQERAMGFEDIVRATGRVKSTISKHMKDLEDDGLIASFPAREDRRKKGYILVARPLGRSSKRSYKLDRRTRQHIARSLEGGGSFLTALLRSIRYRFDSLGMDVEPMLYHLGREIGEVIGEGMGSVDLEGLMEEVAAFWKEQGLGTVTVLEWEPLTFLVTDCYECSNMPDVGRTLCAFDEGILEAIFLARLGKEYRVKELECWGTGYTHCKYLALPL
ncbi:MAG: ArsR family transcriptional regulator [Euryarchaeota archaeon]|nr:ArsR family transcriptional regulator [Euryarchaeota archaeon]